jgi:hypothetical protein
MAITAVLALVASALSADPLKCNLADYRSLPGLAASVAGDALTLGWGGEKGQELRLRFVVAGGTPTIQELAVKRSGAAWAILASNVTPDFRVVSGLRRVTDQQLDPLRRLHVDITQDVIDKYKWDAFWDAPLNLEDGGTHGEATPPKKGLLRQPGWPRKAFGRHHFQIPFDAAGKKWVRFAAWDTAGNGAMVQPIRVGSSRSTD